MLAKNVFIPRAKIPEDWLTAIRVAAAERGSDVDVSDLIREAIALHPDIRKEADRRKLPPLEISRGGKR